MALLQLMILHCQMVQQRLQFINHYNNTIGNCIGTKFEADETVVIKLNASSVSSNTTASGSNMSHTYQINNDDTKPTLNFSAVISEVVPRL